MITSTRVLFSRLIVGINIEDKSQVLSGFFSVQSEIGFKDNRPENFRKCIFLEQWACFWDNRLLDKCAFRSTGTIFRLLGFWNNWLLEQKSVSHLLA